MMFDAVISCDILIQGSAMSPTLRPQTGTGPWPIKNQAART